MSFIMLALPILVKIVELIFWVLLSCAIGTGLVFMLFLFQRAVHFGEDDKRH